MQVLLLYQQSNVRGHLVLLVTDQARNPEAFGGQPVLRLGPGESTTLAWELGWYASAEDFAAATRPPAVLSAYAAELGESILVEASSVSSPDPGVAVERTAEGRYRARASRHGSVRLDIADGARTEVLFHLPLEEVVRRRAAYITRHQRARERPGLLAYAFVPVDTRTGLTQATNGWSDWTDGSERIAMPLLLQAAVARGLADAEEIDPLLEDWSGFARRHLLDDTAAPRRGSQTWHIGPRLYDTPWPARFFHDRHRATAGRRTSISPPGFWSAASNSAAPPICPSACPRRRWSCAPLWRRPDSLPAPMRCGINSSPAHGSSSRRADCCPPTRSPTNSPSWPPCSTS
ncbi:MULTISPECIES: hypothetical protein [unclassified Streptomyces]|uniref:hypothetical protein n=1 Tax=unclassified Streptomyces TaxID=2593676 RepID=UPI003431A44D